MKPAELRELQVALLQGAKLTPAQEERLKQWSGAADYQAVLDAIATTAVPLDEPSETMDARILAAARRQPPARRGWLAAWLGESWSGWHWATTGLAGALGVAMALALVRAWLPGNPGVPSTDGAQVASLPRQETLQPLAAGVNEPTQAPLQVFHPNPAAGAVSLPANATLAQRHAAVALAYSGDDVEQKLAVLQAELALGQDGEQQAQSYLDASKGI